MRVAAGEDIAAGDLVAALEDADAGNQGPLFYQSETEGLDAELVWGVAVSPLAFAAHSLAMCRGERPFEIVENVDEVDLPKVTADYLGRIPGLDAGALRAACDYLTRTHHSRAAAAEWGAPVDMGALRRAAGRDPAGPPVVMGRRRPSRVG